MSMQGKITTRITNLNEKQFQRKINSCNSQNLNEKNGKLHIQAGGGLVYDSNPEDEYQETINKAGALMAAAEDSYKYN